ncbi:four helix bundle protein [Sandaracinomonas limnophila]|uniref:Four helix bundle protein n=1 Tax=Sandaracinomonas limnophila TaxID=1862386 RepID=A0A437PU09_9BACT|nr:four helix bundle protein [Sandaracinomonas limnophila]RVU25739.1 four helix bundle protein [Sandaracinomonas limnophila]
MPNYSNLQEKAINFAIQIKDLNHLLKFKKEFVIADQIFRSSTSVGANIWEAKYSESRNDLIHKYAISLKEINETLFWLDLLFKSQVISLEQYQILFEKGEEILKILITIIKKLKGI